MPVVSCPALLLFFSLYKTYIDLYTNRKTFEGRRQEDIFSFQKAYVMPTVLQIKICSRTVNLLHIVYVLFISYKYSISPSIEAITVLSVESSDLFILCCRYHKINRKNSIKCYDKCEAQ